MSDLQKCEIVGCHRNGQSLKDIHKELKIPKSRVSFVIKKRKVIDYCWNVFRPGRPKKLTGRDQRVLSKEIRENRTKPISDILQEKQKTTMTVVSMNIISKEAHLLGFHGRAATHKPLITKLNHAAWLR